MTQPAHLARAAVPEDRAHRAQAQTTPSPRSSPDPAAPAPAAPARAPRPARPRARRPAPAAPTRTAARAPAAARTASNTDSATTRVSFRAVGVSHSRTPATWIRRETMRLIKGLIAAAIAASLLVIPAGALAK